MCKGAHSLILTTVMEADNQYIYITSNASKHVFPHNTSHAFENVISPLMLDPSLEYEVSLINFLHPKNYYSIRANDVDFAIQFVYTCDKEPHAVEHNIFKYVPKFNMLGQMKGEQAMLALINDDIFNQMKEMLGMDAVKKYMPNGRLFVYDLDIDRCRLETTYHTEGGSTDARCYPDVGIRFSRRMAHMLGFDESGLYRYYVPYPTSGQEKWNSYNDNISTRSPRTDGGVDFIYIYSDIVVPSRFAGQQVNILDAFAWQGLSAKGSTPVIYKQLLNKNVHSVGVRIADQNGYPLIFEEGHSVTLILHIRPR